VLFNAAHSEAASRRLAQRLLAERAAGRFDLRALVFGATVGRDPARLQAALLEALPRDGLLLLTTAPGERGVPARELLAACPEPARAQACGDPLEALAAARRHAAGGGVVVTGSLYLVGLLLGAVLGPGARAAVGGDA
jgi:folylpolyglutamate synthase/dihydropteroate synthase